MARILFVGVKKGEEQIVLRKVCAKVGEAAGEGRRTALLAASANQAARLDDLLWTFEEASFLPHSVLSQFSSPMDKAIVTAGTGDKVRADQYVNFTSEPILGDLLEGSKGEVVVYEFVREDDEGSKEAARRKWNRYREAGLSPGRQQI